MAVVEPEGSGDAWERRRVLMSLRIERAGLELLQARGLDNVTVDQIAAEAEISTRTFFRYFRNPRDILNGVPRRESRRMCEALLERPADESLVDSFHAWFSEIEHGRDLSSPTAQFEADAFVVWSRIVRAAPDVVQFESRAISVLSTDLEEVVRRRLGFGSEDEQKVGVLAAAFAAVIWYVYTRSLWEDGPALSQGLDQAFDLLGLVLSTPSPLPS